ncbi:MAG: hypothetical protein FWF63_10600 [Fibromonadales bacterium]|nr:hypothetical protein [Fibromonadales bacterium]
MVLRFFIFAVAFLISCTSEERDSVCDEKSVKYNYNVCVEIGSSNSIPSSVTYGPPVSYEGETYKTLVIGTQTWFQRNLNYGIEGGRCYNHDYANCTTYGRLYNWEAAMNACPSGWHIPSNSEWNELINFVGGTQTAGRYLKTRQGWNGSTSSIRNSVGFSALPGGYGASDYDFRGLGSYGGWWSSSESEVGSSAYVWSMSSDDEEVIRYEKDQFSLYSVRCVKD